ncbi:hypothetical protein [Acanthopleuribacter pedis]|uniref:Uncharacterized protein n=1 Tax=Acanthopleuribacter pedis TaxID=442870 RepID=A0A8J7QQW9_9BACT|nr:hypothetical protein [Acanthopleuribacter pedis]
MYLGKIKRVTREAGRTCVYLTEETPLKVSRRRKKAFLAAMQDASTHLRS